MNELKMPIMEIFGPTIQGEGMVVGRKTMFIRTGGCDYSCSWCDSAFTWNGTEKAKMMFPTEVLTKLFELSDVHVESGMPRNFNHITISGGNPALIGDAMQEFIYLCHSNGIKVGLETQGSKWQPWFAEIDDLTISPKPPSSGMTTNFTILDRIIEDLETVRFHRREEFFSLKVVVFDDIDYFYAQQIHQRYTDVPFYLSVGNTDATEQGDISGRLLQKLDWLWSKVLADPIMNDARPLPQLHTLVWANRRKV